MTNQAPHKNDQTQKFIDKARELGCDETEAVFDEKLKRITPKPTVPKFNEEAVKRAEQKMPRKWRED